MKETAYFAAGCFWHVQNTFDNVTGVIDTEAGYMGGNEKVKAEYKNAEKENYAETVKVIFDNEKVSYEQMPHYYHFAKVGVSASWFETTGLTSLEALYSGTNAVASGERAKECLGELASYCYPYDTDSIQHAIEKEYYAPRPVVPDGLLKEYTWENAARKTLAVYEELMQ